jgi:hypothetical protein
MRRPVMIVVGATAAGLGALILSTLVAGTSSAQGAPSDPRAEFIMGNVAPGDCRGLGAPIPESAITFTITTGQILTITAVDPGFVVTATFVKGGADTNLYQPGLRGLPQDPPWINLISPLTGGGQLPAISHWFACGSVTPPTTTTTTTTTTTAPTTTTTAPTTTTTAPTTTTTTVPTSTTTTPTTDDDDDHHRRADDRDCARDRDRAHDRRDDDRRHRRCVPDRRREAR